MPSRVSIHEVPAPAQIAPYAVAISAETALHVEAEAPATGRFVCLYDPQTQEGWGGEFRVIALVATDTELALGEDPLAGEVAWSWLRECLESRDADYDIWWVPPPRPSTVLLRGSRCAPPPLP